MGPSIPKRGRHDAEIEGRGAESPENRLELRVLLGVDEERDVRGRKEAPRGDGDAVGALVPENLQELQRGRGGEDDRGDPTEKAEKPRGYGAVGQRVGRGHAADIGKIALQTLLGGDPRRPSRAAHIAEIQRTSKTARGGRPVCGYLDEMRHRLLGLLDSLHARSHEARSHRVQASLARALPAFATAASALTVAVLLASASTSVAATAATSPADEDAKSSAAAKSSQESAASESHEPKGLAEETLSLIHI